jgi:hypothetical protein
MPRKNPTPEGFVKLAILELLAVERIFALRVNSGMILLSTEGRKRAIQLAPKGTGDLLAIVPVAGWFQVLWIETKAPEKGPTPEQCDFRDSVLEKGHAYIIARSVDDVRDWLTAFRKLHPKL